MFYTWGLWTCYQMGKAGVHESAYQTEVSAITNHCRNLQNLTKALKKYFHNTKEIQNWNSRLYAMFFKAKPIKMCNWRALHWLSISVANKIQMIPFQRCQCFQCPAPRKAAQACSNTLKAEVWCEGFFKYEFYTLNESTLNKSPDGLTYTVLVTD